MKPRQNQDTYIQTFSDYLERNHLRKTPERMTIIRRVVDTGGRFTIEQVCAPELLPPISRATAYNTVKLLVKARLLRKLNISEKTYYELDDRSATCHLVCDECGKVKQVRSNQVTAFMLTQKFPAFNTSHYSLTVYGLCSTCARKLKRANSKKTTIPRT